MLYISTSQRMHKRSKIINFIFKVRNIDTIQARSVRPYSSPAPSTIFVDFADFVGAADSNTTCRVWTSTVSSAYLCHTPIKPDLLGFPGLGVFVCGLRDHVITRFASNTYLIYSFVCEVSTRDKLFRVGCHIWDQLACSLGCLIYQFPPLATWIILWSVGINPS